MSNNSSPGGNSSYPDGWAKFNAVLAFFSLFVAIVIGLYSLIPNAVSKKRDAVWDLSYAGRAMKWQATRITFYDPPVGREKRSDGHKTDVYLEAYDKDSRLHVPWQFIPADVDVYWDKEKKVCVLHKDKIAVIFRPDVHSVRYVYGGSKDIVSYWIKNRFGRGFIQASGKIIVEDSGYARQIPFYDEFKKNVYVPLRLALMYWGVDINDVAKGGDVQYVGVEKGDVSHVNVYLHVPYEDIPKRSPNDEPIDWKCPDFLLGKSTSPDA